MASTHFVARIRHKIEIQLEYPLHWLHQCFASSLPCFGRSIVNHKFEAKSCSETIFYRSDFFIYNYLPADSHCILFNKQHLQKNAHLQMSRTLNFDISAKWQLENSHTASSRFWICTEPFGVDLVDSSKILHVRDKDVDLDDIIDRGSCCFKYSREVLEDLFLLSSLVIALDKL